MALKTITTFFDLTQYFGKQGFGIRRIYVTWKRVLIKEKGKLRYKIPCEHIEVELEDYNE